MIDPSRSPLWTRDSQRVATEAHDALLRHTGGVTRAQMTRQDDVLGWDRTVPYGQSFAQQPQPGTPLYEPSHPAPEAGRIVCGLAMIGVGVLLVLQGIGRLRNPWGMAAFALIVAVVAAFAVGGR